MKRTIDVLSRACVVAALLSAAAKATKPVKAAAVKKPVQKTAAKPKTKR